MRVVTSLIVLLLTCSPLAAGAEAFARQQAESRAQSPSVRSARASARATSEPARFAAGGLPTQSPTVVGWEQAYVDLQIDKTGAVEAVQILETTPGFDDRVGAALAAWRFTPAMHDGDAVRADIFVALIYRPPVLYNTPTIGNPPETRSAPQPDAPYPTATETPAYPVQATGDAQVLVEVEVDQTGAVSNASIVSPPSGFDAAAREAAQRWRFRAAQEDGRPIASIAYLAFSFRQPVSGGAEARSSIEKSTPSQRSASGQ